MSEDPKTAMRGSRSDGPLPEGQDLKPCPFCGGPAISAYVRNGRHIVCQVCGAEGPPAFDGRASRPPAEERATAAWNLRPSSPPEDELSKLSGGWEKPEAEEDDGVISVVAVHSDKQRMISFTLHPDHVRVTESLIGKGSTHQRLFVDPTAPAAMALQSTEAALAQAREALEEVRQWISGWSPNFTQDDEWPATDAKISEALSALPQDHDRGEDHGEG